MPAYYVTNSVSGKNVWMCECYGRCSTVPSYSRTLCLEKMFWCVNAMGVAVLYRVTPELCVWRKCLDVWMLWVLQYCTKLLQKIISVIALIVGWFWVWKHVWFFQEESYLPFILLSHLLKQVGPVVQNLKLLGNMALKFLSWNMANTLIIWYNLLKKCE